MEAVSLGSIQEADDVIRVGDGPENVLLLIVGDNTGLQFGEVVGSTADPDEYGGVLLLVGVLEDLVEAVLAVLERRFESDQGVDVGSDSELLHDVAGLEHVPRPFLGFGASV